MKGRNTPMLYTPEELERRIAEYFELCEASKKELELKSGDIVTRYMKPPSMVGLACHLGVSRQALYMWLDGEYLERLDGEAKTRVLDMLSRARDRIETITIERSMTGDYNPKIAAMVLTNFGYTKADEDKAVVIKLEGAGADAQSWSK